MGRGVLNLKFVTQFHIQGIRSLLFANNKHILKIKRNIFERGWFTKTTYSSVIVLVVSQSIWELQLVTRNMKDEWLGRANSVSVQVGNRLNIFKNDPFTQYRTNFRPDEKLDRTLDDVNMNCGVYLKSESTLCLTSNKQYWTSFRT